MGLFGLNGLFVATRHSPLAYGPSFVLRTRATAQQYCRADFARSSCANGLICNRTTCSYSYSRCAVRRAPCACDRRLHRPAQRLARGTPLPIALVGAALWFDISCSRRGFRCPLLHLLRCCRGVHYFMVLDKQARARASTLEDSGGGHTTGEAR
jgi:hypothetical protein